MKRTSYQWDIITKWELLVNVKLHRDCVYEIKKQEKLLSLILLTLRLLD